MPKRSILAIGGPGSGKTTQLRTFPGRKFVYQFDPMTLAALGDVEFEHAAFVPSAEELDISVKTLKTGVGDKSIRKLEPTAYLRFQDDLYERLARNFFDDFPVVMLDSLTTFQMIVMDRVMHLSGRLGKQPEQADWSAQIANVTSAIRILSDLPCQYLYLTAHHQYTQDTTTKRLYNKPEMTGKLRLYIPSMVSDIFALSCASSAHEEKFIMQTRPSRENPIVRTTMRGLEYEEDITILDWNKPTDYGLGRLFEKGPRTRPKAPPTLTGRASLRS